MLRKMILVSRFGVYLPGKPITSIKGWWDVANRRDLCPFCDEVIVHLFGRCPIPDPHAQYRPAVILEGDLWNEEDLELLFFVNTGTDIHPPDLRISFKEIRELIGHTPELKAAQVLHEMRRE